MSDIELVDATRAGENIAFAELWKRHLRAALRAAAQFDQNTEAEDIVASAFTRIFARIREGGGPTGPFRPYLMRAISNIAQNGARSRQRVVLMGDDALATVASAADEDEHIDRTLAVEAYRRLPRRQRELLWFSEVNGLPNDEVARIGGYTAGAVATALFRARQSLRHEFVQGHISRAPMPRRCRVALAKAARYIEGSLPPTPQRRMEAHLSWCDECRRSVDELRTIASHLVPRKARRRERKYTREGNSRSRRRSRGASASSFSRRAWKACLTG